MKKLLSGALALALCATLAGCGSSNSDDKTLTIGASITPHAEILNNIKPDLEEMGYTVNIVEFSDYVKPNTALEDGELDALANYYGSIQNEDVELFQSCTVSEYMESLYKNAYGDLLDDSAYVSQQKKSYEDQMGGAFTFSQIMVNGCLKQDETGSNAEYLTGMLDELNGDSNYCAEHMESCKTLTVQPVITNGTDTTYCDEVTVFIIELDNKYYVCA